jgi:SMODS and SLOG-associating 2TM effector domain 2
VAAMGMAGVRRQRDADLETTCLPVIGWDGGRAGLSELYTWAEQSAGETIGWYLSEKKRKAAWSKSLRALAAILVTIGGAVPVAALAAGKPVLGNWGFVLLAMAAGCLAYDRFFGYSASWLRYMATAISLRSQLSEFQLAWVADMAAIGRREPSAGDIQRLVEAVRSFMRGVNDTVQSETQAWLVEFNTNLSELEARLYQSQSPSGSGVAAVSAGAADSG